MGSPRASAKPQCADKKIGKGYRVMALTKGKTSLPVPKFHWPDAGKCRAGPTRAPIREALNMDFESNLIAPTRPVFDVQRATERATFDHGWLLTSHSFSFADYFDPRNVN